MEELQRLYSCYLEHVMAFVNGHDVFNQVTGHREMPNLSFLERVEGHIGLMISAGPTFRQHIALQVARYQANNQVCDVECLPLVKRGLMRFIQWRNATSVTFSSQKTPVEPIHDLGEFKNSLAAGLSPQATKSYFDSEGGFWHNN